ncbi:MULTISPECIES: sensor histidine kinase [Phyllobacterium]|jgi:two-component system, OmpR family, sensor histidine kinase KdpD|uniref:histidine kinase n=1 Tax=Phyllobacterium sophorae TaxID=1520277 RepID=A0A2P7BL73_9HYPH|nr:MULTISPECIES: sensor histidine kinase KdpD [Phyllobacterium]PSH67219.1 sensor histidine kinase KdpD [Phyllobacterium sophorae]UXN65450.1 sensor histidine kinase KdpD [Phyllobacterium sp. A18/5-2]
MADHGQRNRPDPDKLLELTARETRGKLTVFLGAAPGVGKTYAMLLRARRLKEDGEDIVIGIAETHGRAETAKLLDGLEVVPRRRVTYRDRALEEFDIDAAIARKPKTLVVDELAHTNVPGSRHPKRYQDIEELLWQGIDVWTAMNVQHLESLSDLVTSITGVTVREIVPDTVLKRADEVLLVDLPPAELIERLKEGKVYLPGNAERAAEGFFKPANLTALRELALRRTADRVDDQMIDLLRQSAIEGPWATGERLLVCVGPDSLSDKVVRTASRLASGLNARWLVVSLTQTSDAGAETSKRIDELLDLAERLGAETRRVIAQDFVEEIFRIARRENVTQIVVGRPKSRRFANPFRRSLPDEIIKRFTDIGVHIVTGEEQGGAYKPPSMRKRSRRELAAAIAIPVITTGMTTLLGLGVSDIVHTQNLSMLFLVAVILSAMISGRLSAVIAAGLSFVFYNFFFLEPLHDLSIAKPHQLFSLVIFLAVALMIGDLAGRLRDQVARSRNQAKNTQALYEFSRKLSGTARLDDVLFSTATQLHSTFGTGVTILLPGDGDLSTQTAWPPDLTLDGTDMTAVRWAFEKNERAGHDTATLPLIDWQFLPILTSHGVAGVLGLFMQDRPPLTENEDRMLIAILDQTAIAIDRAQLVRENAKTTALQESEKLHTALFSSLSHDLRTPLASITGAVTTLRQLGDRIKPDGRDDLLLSIEEEAGRLTRFVANLFDMTRIEAGTLKVKNVPIDAAEVIVSSIERMKKLKPEIAIEISIAPDLPAVNGDPSLLGQVLFNLLDNAAKYAGDGPIAIYARQEDTEVAISVTDQGKGIPPKDLDKIFDKFYRRVKGDGRAAGTGLGLSIARGFVESMGGTIKAESPAIRKRGTRFIVRLPRANPTGEAA